MNIVNDQSNCHNNSAPPNLAKEKAFFFFFFISHPAVHRTVANNQAACKAGSGCPAQAGQRAFRAHHDFSFGLVGPLICFLVFKSLLAINLWVAFS